MKKTLFVALLACFTLMFASCNKEKELAGTNWKTHTTTSQSIAMATVNMTIDGTMKFTDATKGTITLTANGTMEAMGMSENLDEETMTSDFTYTFDGEKGVMTITEDGETEAMPFTYNKKDNTIAFTFSISDDETGLNFSFDMVFNEDK
jgi:hypothetical protein